MKVCSVLILCALGVIIGSSTIDGFPRHYRSFRMGSTQSYVNTMENNVYDSLPTLIREEYRPYVNDFRQFVQDYEKEYETVEELLHRFYTFVENKWTIDSHNNAGRSFRLEMNKFGDLNTTEFKDKVVGHGEYFSNQICNDYRSQGTEPDHLDWRSRDVVTPVKNQGQCGSCWAFSTTGSIESATAIDTGNLVSLSEQELVDCSGSEGNHGCNGGMYDQGFEYVFKNKGLCTEEEYQYHAEDGKCKSKKCTNRVSPIRDCYMVTPGNQQDMKNAVSRRPVSVAIEADKYVFQFYKSGVLDDTTCGTELDHAVLVVGYGTDSYSGLDYWLVKNSWGEEWGDEGYVRILRTDETDDMGICGIASDVEFPVVSSVY